MGRGQELLDAAREGDRKTVEKIIGQINKRSGPFPSIRRGPGVNVQDDNGYTPLHHACLNGHKEIVELLLSVDASPCITDKRGATPLHLATFKGFTDVARILLAHNNPPVNIDHVTLNQETALLMAAQYGFDDFVALLISRGADVSIRNINDESALDLAAQHGRLKTVKFLLRIRPQLVEQYKASPNRESIYLSGSTTPLHRAAKHGHMEVVIALIEAGVDPNIRTDSGTPLHEAACFARADVVRELLRRGADLKARDKRGKTVYDLLTAYPEAATRKVREVIREFVAHKSSYDSEEDLPPFPVAHDYSPTAHMSNLAKASASLSLGSNKCNVQNIKKLHKDEATNAYDKTPVLTRSPEINVSKESIESELIARTDSFLTKQKVIKKLITDADTRGNEIIGTKEFVNHCAVLSELQNLQQNVTSGTNLNSKSKKILKSNVFKRISNIWSGLDPEQGLRPNRLECISIKKPLPSPKPKVKLNVVKQEEVHKNKNKHLTTTTITHVFGDSTHANCNPDDIYQNLSVLKNNSEKIYENLPSKNVPDDVKGMNLSLSMKVPDGIAKFENEQNVVNSPVKTSVSDFAIEDDNIPNLYECMDPSLKITVANFTANGSNEHDNHYLEMNLTAKLSNADFTMNLNNSPDLLYECMDPPVKSKATAYISSNKNQHKHHILGMAPPLVKSSFSKSGGKFNNNQSNNFVANTQTTHPPSKMPENLYLPMIARPSNTYVKSGFSSCRSSVKRLSLSVDYIHYYENLELRCTRRKKFGRMKSIPDCFYFGVDSKPYSMHIRGIPGCLFEQIEHEYIYELNRKTIRGNIPPFIKKKEVQLKPPCYCKDLSDYQEYEAQYYSCEKVNEDNSQYSFIENVENSSVNEIVENIEFIKLDFQSDHDPNTHLAETAKKLRLLKKKYDQLKAFFTDWMAPETQKMSNKNDSLFPPPPSSLTKSHPQSFVQKLASKCLGLKAKFNSAPNISNHAGTESEVDAVTKSTTSKSNTNTLLIGNSKFFKILSKKEESGDIVCNDEFDTISLDRLGTLNRDSVVNRSNRSCPGFKTSLPNISENNELSDHESISESVVIIELDCDKSDNKINSINEAINYNPNLNIFEPRERTSIISNASAGSTHLINECYESYEFHKNEDNLVINSFPRPYPRPNATRNDDNMIYENVLSLRPKPTPAARTHIPPKPLNDLDKKVLYENISVLRKPEPPKRTVLPPPSSSSDKDNSRSVSRSSTLSSDSLVDETNLEDIFLSQKSKSFKHGQVPIYSSGSYKSDVRRTQSTASDSSDVTEASAIENVDCSDVVDDKALYLSMTGTLPNKKTNTEKKKVLFRHKTFTNIEVDRNSVRVKDLPQWNNEFLKETLAHYHIRGTGHCIYSAPTVQEFLYIFNRDTLYKDVPPFTKVANDKRDSYFETGICFCKPRPPKHHNSAEDLLERVPPELEEKVSIDLDALKNRREIFSASFKCFCDSGTCTFHSNRRESLNDLVVKFSAIKRSISTPDITLNPSFSTVPRTGLSKNYSVPHNLEEPYAVVSVEDIIQRNEPIKQNDNCESYSVMSHPSTLSSTASRMYSIKDIAEVISLNKSSSTTSTLSNASDLHLPVRKSSSSEYSGHWSLQSCNSNVTIKSDASFKTCLEESSDENSDDTLHSDDESDTETIKSDISTVKRPWVHSDSFRFGSNTRPEIETILEESHSSFEEKFESMSSKFESGISVEGSESSSSDCEEDSGVPRGGDMSLDASLERGSVSGGVRSGSGRRRWDEMEGTSEGDALSLSSAASSCAPLHLAHHHDYSKVSPTPPKKPPRRNLSVSPTHANSPSSGYSYELRVHARSQDDLDDIQGAKHYLKHGRSVDHYVDSKLSYSEYEENHNSPRVAPIPNPRPSLKQRSQPVAITAMYENVVIKEQNPRRKLRRNNFTETSSYDPRMTARKYSHQERSSLESLLDDQSMNSPSDCERYYDGPRVDIPLSPSHYEQPPTPDHPPPSARQAENSIHERIRPLSQEYKRRSQLRDSYTETEVNLLRAASAASVASGATDRSGKSDNCVEEYVCDVPFAGLFKGSTTTLDGIGLRPMPAERPKTLRKLKSVYDSSPTEPLHSVSNGVDRNTNGVEEEVRRRSNTTSSTQSGDKSLSILSPFDEQEEWAKISEIMASFGSKLVRESVFVSELEQEFTSRLGLSCSESSLSPSVASNLGLWLSGMGLHDYETLFLESGFDDIDFVNGVLDENDLREMGIEENDRHKIIESAKQLPLKITEISNNHNNNNISNKHQNESVDEWLRQINLEQYSDTFRKHLYVDMDRVRRIWEVELTAVLEIQKAGHRKRILASVSGEHNGPINHMEDINTDLNTLKKNIQQLKEEIKEKLPSENLKPVPPPVVPTLMPPGGETLKRSKKNRPAPQPPRPSDLEIRAPSELLVGVPGALKTQWKHQPFVLVTGAVTYVANYLGSTVVKELRGTESTKKSIQKLKKTTKEPRDSPDIILSISYRGVKFLNTITRELICEHEIRNIHCACQDADDLTHFAYITKDHATRSHYCHVFRVATMDQATEVILTLGEAFEVAYQMALREQSNRTRVTQSLAKTPTHDPMTTANKEKPNVNHGRSHSITEIKLNGHQLKIAPLPASLSNEDFQASTRNSDGSRSPRTPLLKAPIASTEEL